MLSSRACLPRIWEHVLGTRPLVLMPGPSCPDPVASLPDLGGTPWTASHEFPFQWYWWLTFWVERNTSLKRLHLQSMGSQRGGQTLFTFTSQSTGGVQLVPFLQFRGGQGIAFLSLSTSLPVCRYGLSEQRGVPFFWSSLPALDYLSECGHCSNFPSYGASLPIQWMSDS